MKRLFCIIAVTAMACLCCCCSKVLVPTGIDLGERKVEAAAGDFPVRIATTGVWYAKSECEWIEVDGKLHEGEGSFVIKYRSNESTMQLCRFNRVGTVKVFTYDGATVGTIRILQKGITPYMNFPSAAVVPAGGGTVSADLTTNLTDSERSRISFLCDVDWISDIVYGRDGRSIQFQAASGAYGKATVTLVHTDAWGLPTTAECQVIMEGAE